MSSSGISNSSGSLTEEGNGVPGSYPSLSCHVLQLRLPLSAQVTAPTITPSPPSLGASPAVRILLAAGKRFSIVQQMVEPCAAFLGMAICPILTPVTLWCRTIYIYPHWCDGPEGPVPFPRWFEFGV